MPIRFADTEETQRKIAKVLLLANAVKFLHGEVINFTSGLCAPGVLVTVSNVFTSPDSRRIVLEGLSGCLEALTPPVGAIAGMATGGIGPAFWLAAEYNLPYVTIRKSAKNHGDQGLVSGRADQLNGQRVLLIEDHISLGTTSFNAAVGLREVAACCEILSVTTYGFPVADSTADQCKLTVHALCSFSQILEAALQRGLCSRQHYDTISRWLANPFDQSWADEAWRWPKG